MAAISYLGVHSSPTTNCMDVPSLVAGYSDRLDIVTNRRSHPEVYSGSRLQHVQLERIQEPARHGLTQRWELCDSSGVHPTIGVLLSWQLAVSLKVRFWWKSGAYRAADVSLSHNFVTDPPSNHATMQ
jgi:hypothetical protein